MLIRKSAADVRPQVVSLLSALLQKLDRWAARFEQRIEQHRRWYLFLFSLLYFSVTVPIALLREMWFDEFITLYTVRFHNLSQLFATLRAGVDLNPPLYHLIVRTSEKLLGENAIALRLPSLLAYWVMALSLFVFVRRRTNALYGLAAALLPFITVAYEYAFEGRPYAIVLGCCPLAFFFWQSAIDHTRRKLALPALAVTIAIAAINHYYGVLLVLPLGIGELVRTATRKKIDWPVWGALILGVAPVFACLPILRPAMAVHERAYDHIWNKAEVTFLWESYKRLIGIAAFPIMAVLAWFAVRSTSDFQRPEDEKCVIPRCELAAAFSLCALPILAYGIAVSCVGMIGWRYVLPTVVGFGIVVAFACYRASSARPATGLLLVLVLLGWTTVHVGLVAREEVAARNRYQARDTEAIVRSANLPILVQDGILALSMDHYVAPDIKDRMAFAVDLDSVRYYEESDTPERVMIIGKDTFPVAMEDFNKFRRTHKQYFVYGLHAGWLLSTVIHDGGKVHMLYEGKYLLLFRIDEKSMPKAAESTWAAASASPGSGPHRAALTTVSRKNQP